MSPILRRLCCLAFLTLGTAVYGPAQAQVRGPAILAFTPPVLAFGSYPVGSKSAPQVIAFSNTGGTASDLRPPVTSEEFAIVETNCGAMIAPGESCSLAITFKPAAPGQRTGSLLIIGDVSHNASLAGSGVPVPVVPGGFVAIAGGGEHTCAIVEGGSVECWGLNGNGELGDGTIADRLNPVTVRGLANAAAISAGTSHSCVVTTGGVAKCWGANEQGQLGDDSTTARHEPVAVATLDGGVAAIAAGYQHTCALTTGGDVKCWGLNHSGQLGTGIFSERELAPVDVANIHGDRAAALTRFGLLFAGIRQDREQGNDMASPFIGEVRVVGYNFAPVGWAFCDGSLLPIAQYDALFALIGTTYGGDGQTTFALPDLRGRTPIHMGAGAGLSSHFLGESFGSEAVALTEQTTPSHYHPVNASSQPGTQSVPDGAYWAASSTGESQYAAAANTSMSAAASASVGGSLPHSNMMPFLAVSFIIATEGIFPSQN